jgi:hypothetical protein
MWKLVDEKTGKEICPGDLRQTFRGTSVTVVSLHPPHTPASSGKVTVREAHGEHQWGVTYYPSVIRAKYVELTNE